MVAFPKDLDRKAWLELCRAQFVQMVPQIRREAHAALRAVDPHRRKELVSEVINCAFGMFMHLAELGKTPLAYPKPLAMTALKKLHGRRGPQRSG